MRKRYRNSVLIAGVTKPGAHPRMSQDDWHEQRNQLLHLRKMREFFNCPHIIARRATFHDCDKFWVTPGLTQEDTRSIRNILWVIRIRIQNEREAQRRINVPTIEWHRNTTVSNFVLWLNFLRPSLDIASIEIGHSPDFDINGVKALAVIDKDWVFSSFRLGYLLGFAAHDTKHFILYSRRIYRDDLDTEIHTVKTVHIGTGNKFEVRDQYLGCNLTLATKPFVFGKTLLETKAKIAKEVTCHVGRLLESAA